MKLLNRLPAIKEFYPKAVFGIMVAQGVNTASGRSDMDLLKRTEIDRIKSNYQEYERTAVSSSEPVRHYVSYYKKFRKTYPVLLQLESILLKDKGIPRAGIPVEAMFLAEVKNQLLTAGHDLDKLKGDLTLNVSDGSGRYTGSSGKELQLTEHDLFLSDQTGILSSVLGGPDYHTRITGATENVLYFVYGVDGITEEQIRDHLACIRGYLLTTIPKVKISAIEVYS